MYENDERNSQGIFQCPRTSNSSDATTPHVKGLG